MLECMSPIFACDLGVDKRGKHIIRMSQKFGTPNISLPCGKCPACLANRRKSWIDRMRLELYGFDGVGSFITLTYNDDFLPRNRKLDKTALRLFLKRFRNIPRDFGFALPDSGLRYFACGEYGHKFKRPHYHAIIFGIDLTAYPFVADFVSFKDGFPIFSSPLLSELWPFGYNTVDTVSSANIRYVSKYITKSSSDEFSLSSLGLGRACFGDFKRVGRSWDYNFNSDFLNFAQDGITKIFENGNTVNVKSPNYVYRYLERFYPELYNEVKQSRREFVLNKCKDIVPPSRRAYYIKNKLAAEQTRRKLDNET